MLLAKSSERFLPSQRRMKKINLDKEEIKWFRFRKLNALFFRFDSKKLKKQKKHRIETAKSQFDFLSCTQ